MLLRSVALCLLCTGVAATLSAQDLERLDSARPFAVSGEIAVSATGYMTTAPEDRRLPFSWTVEGTITPTVYEVALPFGFLFSREENQLRQPFNEFGLTPRWRWLTAYLGYGSMHFTPWTLAGNRFLGAGVDARPGPFRISALYGRFQRATPGDTTLPNSLPAYERTGAAARLGFGDETSWIDAQWLHIADDTASLVQRGEIRQVTPMENSVLGMAGGVEITEQIKLDGEISGSLLTRDRLAAPLAADSGDLPSFLSSLQSLRSSTTLALAARAGVELQFHPVRVRAGYERVEPDYTSLGAGPIAGDLETWSIAPAVELDSGRLLLDGSIGVQRDNLLGTKLATSQRLVGALGVQWNPSEIFGVDARYNGYTVAQQPTGTGGIDTLGSRTVTGDFSLSPRLTLGGESMTHSLFGVVALQEYTDRRTVDGVETATGARTLGLNYSGALTGSGATLSANLLWTSSESGSLESDGIGGELGGSLPLFDDALQLDGTVGWNRTVGSDTSLGDLESVTVTTSGSLGAQLRVADGAGRFRLSLSASRIDAPEGFDEATLTLGYTHTIAP